MIVRYQAPRVTIALASLGLCTLAIAPTAAATSFTFGSVGDHGASTNSTGTFKAIGADTSLEFFISNGDLSYINPTSVDEQGWCQYVKNNLNSGRGLANGNAFGENYPFQIIAGNHESDQTQNNGLIDNFVAPTCLPNRMSQAVMSPNLGTNPHPVTGNYAKEYYFDYPAANPIARFILVGAGLNFEYGGAYNYTVGSARYNWLASTIDSARASGIKWVIVNNHKQYISVGSKGDEVGSDYFNLLVNKKVDLILQGHDHTYQRTKQLAQSAACPAVTKTTPDLDCIVDDGSDDNYKKGNGTVLVIAGHGGVGYYAINTADTEMPYFAKTMGTGADATSGYLRITVNDTELSSQFIRGAGANFTDSFSITPFRPADITQDDLVNIRDFSVLSTNYGKSGAAIKKPRADINKDGVVNLADFSILSAQYNT